MYFNEFPLYEYDLQGNKQRKLVTNIIQRVKVRANVRAQTLVMDSYNVQDGETPEIVADKYYGDSKYHWVILLINNLTNRFDFPMPQRAFNEFLIEKYGAGNQDNVHHHEVSQSSGDTALKLIVSSDTTGATPITNREHEQKLQNEKRQIKLLDSRFLKEFVEEYRRIM